MSTSKTEQKYLIGERFRFERERLDYTQAELAKRLEVTPKTVIKYESGETSPNAETLAVFHSLGADVTYIVTGQRSPAVAASGAERATPAARAAAEIAGMRLTEEDAQLLLAMARRLAKPA